jgi:surface carbohydrate biosynthesis protein
MRIALIVDNPYRDLPGLVLLAAQLCRQGATCFLVPMYSTGELIMLAPDVVLFNYLRVNNEEAAQRMRQAGVKVCVLDTEGGVLPDLERYTKTAARDPELFHNVSCFFSWGPRLAEYLQREGLYREEQVLVTGAPRFDFYVPPLRCAALRASTYVEAYPQPLVLFNGNFPFSNPRFQTPEEEVRMMVTRFGFDRGLMLEWQENSRRGMRELTALANGLARRFPHVTFVYRPHPFENAEAYGPLLERRDNLHLAKVGTVDGWILRSAAVVQRSCSTAIEAGMAGVPALMPTWVPTAAGMPSAEDVSIPCDTEEELARTLGEILAGDFRLPEGVRRKLEAVVEDWFYRVDGRAHERIAARLLELAGGGGRRARVAACRTLAYRAGEGASLKQRARQRAIETLRLPLHWSFRRLKDMPPPSNGDGWEASEKFFDAGTVDGLLDALRACEPEGTGGGRWRGVRARQAAERGDYHFGYPGGRAVTLSAE